MNGDFLPLKFRESAVLTTSYVASATNGDSSRGNIGKYNQLVIYHKFTKGSLTSAELIIEFSPNGTDWAQETVSSISTGTDTLTSVLHQVSATGVYRYLLPIKDNYVRVSVKGTGTVTGSLSEIWGMLGIA